MIKLCQCLSYFPSFLAILKVWLLFKNRGTNLTPKQSNMIFWSNFERYNNKVAIFQKSLAILTENEDKPNSRYLSKVFPAKNFFTVENLWLFVLFSRDKGDNTDLWMIKITIKANQIDMDVLLISKVDNIQKPCLSLKSGFFHYFIGL